MHGPRLCAVHFLHLRADRLCCLGSLRPGRQRRHQRTGHRPTGAIIPGAKVVAQNQATGLKLSTVSTAAGFYSFVSLSPGNYQVTASAKGFETLVQKNVTVTVDQVTTVNIALKVGSVSEVVTVNETTSLVDTSNSTVGQLISAETIDRVPLLTRNVFDLFS